MTDKNKIRLLIAEQHPVLREAIKLFFSVHDTIEIVGQAAKAEEILPLVEALQPDIILIGSNVSSTNMLTFVNQLHEESPAIQLMVLASNYDPATLEQFLEPEEYNLVVKNALSSELLTTIRQAHSKV